MVADRGAAGRHQDIGAGLARPADACGGGLHGVGGHPKVDRVGAFGPCQRAQGIAVGIDDLAGAWGLAGHDELVAGGEQRKLRPLPHRQLRIVHAGRQREVAIAEAGAGCEQHVALAEIDSRRADIAPRACGFRDGDRVAVGNRVLLDHDGVGAIGDHAAGEDARGLSGPIARSNGRPAATSPITFSLAFTCAASAARTA